MKEQLYVTVINGKEVVDTYENLIKLTKGMLGNKFNRYNNGNNDTKNT